MTCSRQENEGFELVVAVRESELGNKSWSLRENRETPTVEGAV